MANESSPKDAVTGAQSLGFLMYDKKQILVVRQQEAAPYIRDIPFRN